MLKDLTLPDNKPFTALDQTFGTAPTSLPAKVEPITVEDDFDQARGALKRMITKGETVVDDMLNVARQSDHPRAYEVAGQLIKTVAETAKDLLALQKTRRELQTPEETKQQQIGTQNNIVFSGSTSDLIDMLREKKRAEIDITPPQK
jgi:prophage tail gpP-like protein